MKSEEKIGTEELRQFTGSEQFYRYGLKGDMLLTEGAKYLADCAGAYWLMDEITLAQRFSKSVAEQEFQLWRLVVGEDGKGALSCDDGNGHIVYTKTIPFTDFPACGIRLYVSNRVIMLPTEY